MGYNKCPFWPDTDLHHHIHESIRINMIKGAPVVRKQNIIFFKYIIPISASSDWQRFLSAHAE